MFENQCDEFLTCSWHTNWHQVGLLGNIFWDFCFLLFPYRSWRQVLGLTRILHGKDNTPADRDRGFFHLCADIGGISVISAVQEWANVKAMKDKKVDLISRPARQKNLKRLLPKKSKVNMKLWLGSKNRGFTNALDLWSNNYPTHWIAPPSPPAVQAHGCLLKMHDSHRPLG